MKKSLIESDNFCFMPWHALTITAGGDIKPCCQWKDSLGKVDSSEIVDTYKNHPKIISLRSDFLKGNKPESCRSCWQREAQIGESRRKWFSSKFLKNVSDSYNYEETITDLIITQADINLSNVCNLKCRMCGSWASNSWFEEEIILASIDTKFEKERDKNKLKIQQRGIDDLKLLVPYFKKIDRIDFKGGEPMMAKMHTEFLEMLIEEKVNDTVTLQYTTNGTIVNPKILDTLSKFKKIRLMFSIEGTGKLYSYIRGGKYTIEQLEKNIDMYNQLHNVEIGFNVTMQAYNLLDLANLYKQLEIWSKQFQNVSNKLAFTTICNSPMYLNPMVLPQDLRNSAASKLKDIEDFSKIVESLESNFVHNRYWQTFKDFTEQLDKLRNEDIFSVIPELKEYWND
jgi:radical SAM protein with 4Fe4S-binding SPASM domain